MPKALSSLAVGNKVEVPVKAAYQSRFGEKIIYKIADKNHSGYPSNSVTLITDRIIQLMCSDAKEPSNSTGSRSSYGNNRHIYSNLLQWLNSNAAAGAWYSAKHSLDAAPTNANVRDNKNEYDQWAGFLAMLDEDFVAALMDTTLTVVKSSTDGGSYESFVSKMFLASTTEVGFANENGIAEGAKLALFSGDTSRIAYPTAQAVSNSEYTDSNLGAAKAWYWWQRTSCVSNAYHVRFVHTSGALNYYDAYYSYVGVRPLCNLSSGILVSDSPNSDGNYEIIWNCAPSTPSGISVPATCYSGQNVTVTWGESTDEDGDAITYTLERSTNGGSYTQVTSTGARTYTEAVSTAWNTLQYRVKAVDAVGNASAYIASSTAAVIHNQPPVISGSNADLGIKREEFTYTYTVTDADGDAVTVAEAIDGTAFNTRAVTLGAENTCTVGGNTFTGLTNAAHTLTITATDSKGNVSVRTLTFTKAINGFVIALAHPLSAQQQPTRCNIVVTREIPAGGTFKVEACNNPFDDAHVWEDCTNAVLQGTAHVFENDTNTALEYGLNIRVTVGREDALTTCWVSGIGGNFE